jgi:hypothetical protein
MTWVTNEQPFGVNHAPLLSGLASDGSGAEVPVAVDKDTGELFVSSGGGTTTPTVPSIVSGQQTATSSAAALSSHSLKQGVVLQALSTNTVSVFIGPSGVTSSTGLELPAGGSVTLPVNNTNVVYIVSASDSPAVTFVGA